MLPFWQHSVRPLTCCQLTEHGRNFQQGRSIDHLPNSLDLLVLLGQTTLGVVAVLVEVGGQTLSTLFLGLATL